MSSWVSSIFSSKPDPTSDDDYPTSPKSSSPNEKPKTPSFGVKEDLSAVLRGVAAFLAPPPGTSNSGVSTSSSSDAITGIKNDLAEIQGSFKSSLSLISSKFTSNFMHLRGEFNGDNVYDVEEEDNDDDDAVGITEDVVDFVRKLSQRPELWIDFPLALPDDFYLSDYQQDHAANIDHLVPELMKMRQNIGSQISDGKFWIIYFILLFPRFNEADLKLLSSAQVVEARETLLRKLQTKGNVLEDSSETRETSEMNKENESRSLHAATPSETLRERKLRDDDNNMESKNYISEEEDDSSASINAPKQSHQEDDISFSDLEDDANSLADKLQGNRVSNSRSDSEASEWIQLHENSGGDRKKAGQSTFRDKESEGEDSNDWLTVDDNLDAV